LFADDATVLRRSPARTRIEEGRAMLSRIPDHAELDFTPKTFTALTTPLSRLLELYRARAR
jgi:hypothetical protein